MVEATSSLAKQRNRRGRQLGRVLASQSDEVVIDRLFEGTVQLKRALIPLMQAAEGTLGLDEARSAVLVHRFLTAAQDNDGWPHSYIMSGTSGKQDLAEGDVFDPLIE